MGDYTSEASLSQGDEKAKDINYSDPHAVLEEIVAVSEQIGGLENHRNTLWEHYHSLMDSISKHHEQVAQRTGMYEERPVKETPHEEHVRLVSTRGY